MKKIVFLLFMISVLLGCQERIDGGIIMGNTEEFEAVIEEVSPQSKTSMDELRNVIWSAGDELAIFQGCTISDKYQVSDASVGKNNGTFKIVRDNSSDINGDFSSGGEIATNIAVYPYSDNLSCANAVVSDSESGTSVKAYSVNGVVLPEVQSYLKGSFADDTFPMVAVTTDMSDHSLKFKNVCGGMKLQFKGTQKVISIKLEGKNNEKLSGAATITAYPTDLAPVITMSSDASTSVTLDCGDGVQLNESTATEFIISLPPVLFSKGFTVTVTDTDGKTYTVETDKANTVLRSSLLIMPEIGVGETPSIDSEISRAGLYVRLNKNVITADGVDCVVFSIWYDRVNISDQALVFQIVDNDCVSITGNSFSTQVVGEYFFKVAYGEEYSEVIKVTATSHEIPSVPEDSAPSNTDFVHRAFFNQHTGANCPNSPFMTYLLKQTLINGYEDKVVLASLRNYSGEYGFANVDNPTHAWPYLHIDYRESVPYNSKATALQAKIDEIVAAPAKVGIAASPKYYDDGQIVVKVSVKAAETDEYNVGLWLMQDNVFIRQQVDVSRLSLLEGTWGEEYHYHNNCVRVAESKYLGSHVGYPLGKIEAGKTAEWIFLVNVNLGSEEYGYTDHWWEGRTGGINLDDLHFAAFVTTPISDGGSVYTVVNAIDFPYNQQISFEYMD